MKRAFSLIEIIFVIVILGIIVSFAAPKLMDTKDSALVSTLKRDVNTAVNSIQSYYLLNQKIDDIKDAINISDSFEDIVHLVTNKIMANNEINQILGVTVAPLAEGLSNVVVISGNTVKNVAKGIFGLPLSFFKHKN